MQKSVRYNEGHALFLSALARKEGTKRGNLCKKSAENSRWHEKFFVLFQNILFYSENEQSAKPAGIYLLEGCTCDRSPAPKMSTTGKEAMEKQVRRVLMETERSPQRRNGSTSSGTDIFCASCNPCFAERFTPAGGFSFKFF